MAENLADIESGNPYGMRLTLLAPRGSGRTLDRILSSLTNWIDPSRQIVDVDEMLPENEVRKPDNRKKNLNGCLVTPSISVMLFVRETGNMCVDDVEKVLKKPPWEFHHKVELQNKNAPRKALAKQEFFKLADDLPLFAACPVLTENEHLRVNLYVHNFPAMVEFYRAITDKEIETNKPEFCIFELFRQPGLDIQLSLKRSQYIYPVPVDSAYISFNIKNISMIQIATDNEIDHVGDNVYTTRDPDGNLVVLYETITNRQCTCSLAGACKLCSNCAVYNADSERLNNSASLDDVKSLKSTAESHDSGRYSDLDGPSTDNTLLDRFKMPFEDKHNTSIKQSDKSEGYASSGSSNLTIKKGSKHTEKKNSSGKTKSEQRKAESGKSKAGGKTKASKPAITPIYI